ncbi:hypothetical protein [Methanobacterium ferruginis]|uniref:hypothetical protein n=1 Tax=Methanobacterium ferruginis TaxID=710191 RepID=UPI0025732CF0|nr:hypothetical protein [Methanobacterium ferruginis]BDZ68615.1 hypothetical protein GCM10025860_20630 [Methanobacterium ferruginis]
MKKILYIILILFLTGITATSGCTSSSDSTDADSTRDDIQVPNTPVVHYYSDGSGFITAEIENIGNSTYTNVELGIEGCGSGIYTIYSTTTTIDRIEPGEVKNIRIDVESPFGKKIKSVHVLVITAVKI